MAEEEEPLSEEAKAYWEYYAQVQEWLENHWEGPRECPVCSEDNWIVGKPAQLPFYTGPDNPLPSEPLAIYPVVPLMCRNCGFLRLFNGVLIGVLPRDEDEDEDEDQKEPSSGPDTETP